VQRNCNDRKSSQKYQGVSVFIFVGVPPKDFFRRSPMTGNATTLTGRLQMTRGQNLAFWLKKELFWAIGARKRPAEQPNGHLQEN
jgi:hypothetical protein